MSTTGFDKALGPAGTQCEMFDLAEVEGYSVLSRRERIFAAEIFAGTSQREAARRAGVKGDEACDLAGSRMIRSPQVRRLLDQAWRRAGSDISETLKEAEEIRRRAYREIVDGRNAKTVRDALDQWKTAAGLIATVHGRLSLQVSGQIQHNGAVAALPVPQEALQAFAELRRAVLVEDAKRQPLQLDSGASPGTCVPPTGSG